MIVIFKMGEYACSGRERQLRIIYVYVNLYLYMYVMKHLSFCLLSPSPDPPLPTDFVCETRDLTSAVCQWNEKRDTNLYRKRGTRYSLNKRLLTCKPYLDLHMYPTKWL